MWKAGLYESHAGIKIAGRNIYNLQYADDTTLMDGRKWGGIKEPLNEGERGECKKWSEAQKKQQPKIMATGPSPPGK